MYIYIQYLICKIYNNNMYILYIGGVCHLPSRILVKIFGEISQEFCDNVATEKWIMKGGMLRIEGESVDTSKAWTNPTWPWCLSAINMEDGPIKKGLSSYFGGKSIKYGKYGTILYFLGGNKPALMTPEV